MQARHRESESLRIKLNFPPQPLPAVAAPVKSSSHVGDNSGGEASSRDGGGALDGCLEGCADEDPGPDTGLARGESVPLKSLVSVRVYRSGVRVKDKRANPG